MNGLNWTAEDKDRLRALWTANTPTPEIAATLNRTVGSIQSKVGDLKLPVRENANWTQEMDDTLRAAFAEGASFREIGEKVGRSRSAAIGRAMRLGLPRTKPSMPKAPSTAEPGEFDLRVKRSATVLTFRPRTTRTVTDSPPLPGSRPRPWTERDVKGGPKLCCWPVDVPGTDIQHSCCMPRDLAHQSYCSAHADLSVGRVREAPAPSPTISALGAGKPFPDPKSVENQSGRAVRQHQPHPSETQTVRSEHAC